MIRHLHTPMARLVLHVACLAVAGAAAIAASPAGPLVSGRFGLALDGGQAALLVPGCDAYVNPPLTVECFARLTGKSSFNLLVANEPKNSGTHWEIYTYQGTGAFSAYLPGYEPSEIVSGVDVVNGQWRHLAMAFDGQRVRLYVDGAEVKAQAVRRRANMPRRAGPLALGTAPGHPGLRCVGLVDEVRISAGLRPIAVPAAPHQPDDTTIGLWHLDEMSPKGSPDAARTGHAAELPVTPMPRQVDPTKAVAVIDGPAFGVNTRSVESDWLDQHEVLARQIRERGKLPPNVIEETFDRHSLIHEADRNPLDVVLRRTTALLEDLQRQPDAPDLSAMRRELEQLKAKSAGVQTDTALYLEACALRRRIAFSNPLLDFDDLLFVARGVYHGSATPGANNDAFGQHQTTQYFAFNSVPGGGLYILRNFKSGGQLVDVLKDATVQNGPRKGQRLAGGAVLSPDLSFDGRSIVFAWTANTVHTWQWTPDTVWHLFRVNIDGTGLVQLTDGTSNDFDPCWLPSGRIAFISERRGGYIRCFTKGAGLPVPTYVLHSMKADGRDIIPLSYFETSEWHPSVNNDGMIVYTRWDYVDREDCLGSFFWICHPDGRDPRAPHGNYPRPYHTFPDNREPNTRPRRPMTELNIRAIPNSHRYMLTATPHHGEAFGSLCILDTSVEDDGVMSQLRRITPYARFPESETPGRRFDTQQYGTAWPLSESYCLCTCHENIYLLDRFGNHEVICRRGDVPTATDGRFRLIDPIPLRPRLRPPVVPTLTRQGEDAKGERSKATISIMNVYDSDLPFPAGAKIEHLRILQVALKDNPWMDEPRIGYGDENTPRVPLGVVPVEADGSAYFDAPVGKELIFQALDENLMAVQSMRSAAYVHPGEQLTCAGCHENRHRTPSSSVAPLALRRPPSALAPEVGGVVPVTYHRLVRPVFENTCLPCHKKEGKGPADMSYPALKEYAFHFSGGFLGRFTEPDHGGSRTIPGRFGARNSRLGKALLAEQHRGRVTPEEFRRVVLWLDANSPQYGAFHDLEAQQRGEIVWPKLDVDPANPTGVEP